MIGTSLNQYRITASSRYDEAIEQDRKTLELDPNFVATHAQLGLV